MRITRKIFLFKMNNFYIKTIFLTLNLRHLQGIKNLFLVFLMLKKQSQARSKMLCLVYEHNPEILYIKANQILASENFFPLKSMESILIVYWRACSVGFIQRMHILSAMVMEYKAWDRLGELLTTVTLISDLYRLVILLLATQWLSHSH